MRTAIISSRFPPEVSPGAKRAADLATALRTQGHGVTVLTQVPNYPDPAKYARELAEAPRLRIEQDPGEISIWRYRPSLAAKSSLFSRLLCEARFAMRVARPSTRLREVDGIVASTPFIFNLVAARSYRVPVWLDVRDLTWEYTRHFGGSSLLKEWGAKALKQIAISSFKAATRVSTTTERQRQYLVDQGVPAEKLVVIPNGVPRRTVETLTSLAGEARRSGAMRVAYAGLLGFPQGLQFAVETVAEMKGEGVELHLYGDGVDRASIEAHVASRGLANVRLHGHVDYEHYLRAIAEADVLFASLRPGADAAMPSKIWEYMAAGRPVVFAGRGEAVDAIDRAGAGLTVDYGDSDGLRARLRTLLNDPEAAADMGLRGREWIMRHGIREEINYSWVEALRDAFASA